MQAPFKESLGDAQRCVTCGMCLPHCPTYAQLRVEADSPRGRITLMQGLAQGRLDPEDPRLRSHIEGCLGCRSCEAVCPAQVPFGRLMDTTRAILNTAAGARAKPTSPPQGAVFAALRKPMLAHPGVGRLAARGARLAKWLRVEALLPKTSLLKRVLQHTGPALDPDGSLARTGALSASSRSASHSDRDSADSADVLLFTGCMAEFFSRDDLLAAVRVLEAAGLRVHVPAGQVCCGAIDQHLGYPDSARSLAEANRAVLTGERPILALDSGCHAELRGYAGEGWKDRVIGLADLLATLPEERWQRMFGSDSAPGGVAAADPRSSAPAGPVRIALHLPCTLRNVIRGAAARHALYARLPNVTLATSHPSTGCCGAGGTAMLTQPEIADALGSETLRALQASRPEIIVSDNVGCRVHLTALASGSETPIPIVSGARFLASRLVQEG